MSVSLKQEMEFNVKDTVPLLNALLTFVPSENELIIVVDKDKTIFQCRNFQLSITSKLI